MQSSLDNVQNHFSNGEFETASKDFADNKAIKDQNNLQLLITGTALFHENKFAESDSAFEEFNRRNLDETGSSFSREVSGVLFGQTVSSYKPYMMDSLFVSYYQIWDLLALGKFDDARVVINQSYARQQKMSIEYKKLIEENKKQIAEKNEYKEIIDNNTGDWLAFTDIMNPALMYLSGIYFLNTGDFDNATTYLKRANGMMPENTFIKQDLQLAQQHIHPKNTTWEFIETGFAPRLEEKNLTLFLPGAGVINFAISEPRFKQNTIKPKSSQILTNVDALFATEYNEYRINEILRSYISAASKAVLQTAMYNSKSDHAPLLGLMTSVYAISSSNADVRTWATLPKNIYVNRFENSKTNLNDEYLDDNIKNEINQGGNNLIYIRYNNDIIDRKIIKLK